MPLPIAGPPPGEETLDVSVVMPVRNGGPLLARQLAALAATTFDGTWEVILSDNGSTDGTVRTAEEAAARLPIRVVDSSEEAGISHARNVGIAAALGRLVLFCDADDEVDPGWVAAMHRASLHADVLGGRLDLLALNDASSRRWQPDVPQDRLPVALGHRPYGIGANLGARADVLRRIGGFDTAFTACSDDVDFCWRAQEAGCSIAFVPDGVIRYRLRDSLRAMARQRYRYGATEALLFRRHRHEGLRRSPPASLARTWWFVVTRLPTLASPRRRGTWVSVAAYHAGRVAGAVRWRVAYW